MATKYFIHENNIQKGPFTKKQLKALNITKDTMVWGEGWPEWMPAGEAYDLKDIFKEATPVPQPLQVVNPRVATPASNFSALIKKWWLPALLVLIAAGATVYFLLRKNSNVDEASKARALAVADSLRADSIKNASKKDTIAAFTPPPVDTTLHIDSSNKTNTDTSVAKTSGNDGNVSIFDIMSGGKKDNANTKKETTTTKTKNSNTKNTNSNTTRTTTETNNETETVKEVNPLDYLSVNGSFRKNLLLEAVMEGTIINRGKSACRNVRIEVRFLDDRGRSTGSKVFTASGTVYGGGSLGFKFKALAPKGTKTASFHIAGA